jgi:transcriptional regulator with XRE-family HTH domain
MPVSNSVEIAALVRETRHRLGLTQLQFAQKLGVSFQSVNRWENGRTQPLPIVLKQIEETLRKMGESGTDLLEQYFADEEKGFNK